MKKNQYRFTIATFFTVIRLLLIPFIVASMITQHVHAGFILFVIAAATDLVDGFLARLLDEKTFLGASLDALADKLLLISCFITLAFFPLPLFPVPYWFVLFVLAKEAILIIGALFLYIRNGFVKIQPTRLGKFTMLMQTLFIIWLFACYFFHWLPIKTYYVMLGLLMVIVITSLFQYISIGWNYLKKE